MIGREAIAGARSQPVASAISILMIAGMVATVLLTTGRTVGAEQAVVGSIDSAGTRSIIVRAEPDAGLTEAVLDRLEAIEGIEWVGAFGPAIDVTNSELPDGTKVPLRHLWSDGGGFLENLRPPSLPGTTGWGSVGAIEALGMSDSVGGVLTTIGGQYSVAGPVDIPSYLSFMGPMVVVPSAPDALAPISVLVVIAERPDLVVTLSSIVQSVLGVDDLSKVKVSTSEGLATLRALIQGQLGTFGRQLVLVIFALTAVLVATVLYGLVLLRRKDFGRRRALGASRPLIVALLLAQISMLGAAGALLGTSIGVAWLVLGGDPLPSVEFIVGVSWLAVITGVVSAAFPAVFAARREPLKELRVP